MLLQLLLLFVEWDYGQLVPTKESFGELPTGRCSVSQFMKMKRDDSASVSICGLQRPSNKGKLRSNEVALSKLHLNTRNHKMKQHKRGPS